MNNYLKLIGLILFNLSSLYGQMNPAPGSKLNYTQVMFEYEKTKNAEAYIIQITEDNDKQSFENLVVEQTHNSTATLINNLHFGKTYLWRYAAIINKEKTNWKGPYTFEIANNSFINMNYFQGRILKNDTLKAADGLVTIDYGKIVIDKKGTPVWYLPGLNTKFNNTSGARDLRITKAGTVTFMANNKAYECNLSGDVIWEAPDNGKISGDTTEYYHHDFKKINNGNYLILGEKYSWRVIPPDFDKSKFKEENLDLTGPVRRVKILFSTIIEYNSKSEVVWTWNSGDYFSDLDLFSKETNTNTPRRDLPANAQIFGHMNAFDTDSTGNKFVYASFRDISRVIKIDKQTGKVVESWGLKMPSGDAPQANDFFKNQHDLNVLRNGDILLFNNNDIMNNSNSSLAVEFSPRKEKNPSQIKWSFDCKFDTLTNGKSARNGGVEQLPNNNMLICMGGINRIVEVNKSDNQVVWDAFIESKSTDSGAWYPVSMYKSHYSSSLYPCYYTVQTNKDTLSAKSPSVIVTIYNEGTNDDSYMLNLSPASSPNFKKMETGIIKPGKSKSLTVSLNMVNAKSNKIVFWIQSKTNIDLTRKLLVIVVR